MSFPLYHKIRGYTPFFNDYEQRLIDANHTINRDRISVMLTVILYLTGTGSWIQMTAVP